MALTITFACDAVTHELTISIANPGGKYKVLGSNPLGTGSPNALGGNDYNFSILVQNTGSGNVDPIVFNAGMILPGKTVKCHDTSLDQLDVWVMEYASTGGGIVIARKQKKMKT